jgi:hypothetical protein
VPRYYFNLRHAQLRVQDPHGEECAGPAEALEHAVVAILGLTTKQGRFRNWAKWLVEIEDEKRRRVAVLPFTLVLKADRRCED